MQHSFNPSNLKSLWELCEEYNINSSELFSKFDLEFSDLDPKNRLPSSLIETIWQEASHRISNPCFGLSAYKYWHPSHFGALGYAWLTSSTLLDAFQRLHRYVTFLNTDADFVISSHKDFISITLNPGFLPHTKVMARTDYVLSLIVHMCRLNFQKPLHLSNVSFIHKEPSCADEYIKYFNCDIRFNDKVDSLTFPKDIMLCRLTGDNPELSKIHEQIIISNLKDITSNNLVQKVRKQIMLLLPSGKCRGETVANELAMSYRNLQRKLNGMDTSFKELIDDCRRELAEKYISLGNFSLTEIAFALGFSELSSFSRAYKRWTGVSPTKDF